MRAIEVTEAGGLRWAEAPEPRIGPGEVGIAARATAVNRADLMQRRGLYPPPPGASPILGLECSGVIDAIGPGVTGWSVGDRVCALLSGGGYAERVAVPAGQLLPVPADLDLVEAAAWPEALCTVWMALRVEAGLRPGERVLWHAGASGVGTVAIAACRVWGHPVAVSASPAKHPVCRALGADLVAPRGDWEAAVRAWAPDGVDVIVDPIGGPTLEADQRVLARDGRIVVLGLMGGRTAPLDLGRLLVQRQRVIGTTLRSRSTAEKARIVAGVREGLWPAVADGRMRAVIDRILPLTAAEEAHAAVAADATTGKVLLTRPDPGPASG